MAHKFTLAEPVCLCCGNKRCLRSTNPSMPCTGPGQPGSGYTPPGDSSTDFGFIFSIGPAVDLPPAHPTPPPEPPPMPSDSERLRYLMGCVEGIYGVRLDRFDYAMHVAELNGRDEANATDELDGFRQMIDDAMAAATPTPGDPEQ